MPLSLSMASLLDALLYAKHAAIQQSPRKRFVYVPLPINVTKTLTAWQVENIKDGSARPDVDHITLVHCPDAEEDLSPASIEAFASALRANAARFPPLDAKLQGWAYFDEVRKDGVPKTALVALVTAPGLDELQADFKKTARAHGARPSETYAFTPHITLAYLPVGARLQDLPHLQVSFQITLARFAHTGLDDLPLSRVPA